MKTFTRWLLALLLVAAPAIAVVHTASANTEMVPASRLVAPYITLETGRFTFLLLANTSAAILNNKTGTVGGVHVEFYSKDCARNDRVVELSENDIDQINITASYASAIGAHASKLGYADIDVRDETVYTNSQTAPSTRQNALTGVVLVADTNDDFAFSYPMAASLGSAASGSADGVIVTRNPDGTGAAASWRGRYEPFPSRLYVPIFYAEGLDSEGAAVKGFLSVVSPADGNWHGLGTNAGGNAEAPGEGISVASGTNALDVSMLVRDGCEREASFNPKGHTIMIGLDDAIFSGALQRSLWTLAKCTGSGAEFPGRDEQGSNEPLGWMRLTNSSAQCKGTSGGCGGAAALRGMAGVFFSRSAGGTPSKKMGDNSRLWGDPTTRTGTTGCKNSTPAGGPGDTVIACVYNFNLTSQP